MSEDKSTETMPEKVKLVNADYSFDWSEDDFKTVATEASAEFAEASKDNEVYFPVAFLEEGKYVFRIWPDRDKNGRPRIIRKEFIHHLPKSRPVKGSDVIEKIIDDAEAAGVKKLWRYRQRQVGFMMVHMYECPPGSDYIKPGMDLCLKLDEHDIYAINEYLSSILSNEKLELLDPRKANHPITLTISGFGFKKNVQAMVNAYNPSVELPPMQLPEGVEWKGLDEIYITDKDVISEEKLAEFRKFIANLTMESRSSGTNIDPSNSGDTGGYKIGQAVAEAAKSASTTRPVSVGTDEGEKCEIVKKASTDPEVLKAWPGAKFGNQPGFGSDDAEKKSVECMLCPFSDECEALTAKVTTA